MRLGLKVNQHQLDWPELRSRVGLAEDLGFDGVWIFDHFRAQEGDPDGPCMEAWSLLAALAVVTDRIRLGALATGVTWRHPSVLAAQAATVDRISGGRLEIALGAAWDEAQHRAFGVEFPALRERVQRMEEAVQVLRLLMAGSGASFEGRHYRLEGATYRPQPVQRPHPPIWIGAGGERRTIPAAARRADVWHCSSAPEELPDKVAVFVREAERSGRDPAAIAMATNLDISEPWDVVRGHVDRVRDLGFSALVIPWPAAGAGRVREFAERVMPELRRGGGS